MRYVTLVSADPGFFVEVVDGMRGFREANVSGEGQHWYVELASGGFLNVDNYGPLTPGDLEDFLDLHLAGGALSLDGAYGCGVALGGSATPVAVAAIVNSLVSSLSSPAALIDPEGQAWRVGDIDHLKLSP